MTDERKILILGGYEGTGLAIAELLLRQSKHSITLAGRDRVAGVASRLNWEHGRERVREAEANVGFKKQLVAIMEDHHLVIDAVRETAFREQIARAALEAGIGFVGLWGSSGELPGLSGLSREVRAAGLTFITRASLDPVLRMPGAFRSGRVQQNGGTSDPQQAIAAVPCVLGILDGSIRKPGVHQAGEVLDHDSYLGKLWDMGMTVSRRTITQVDRAGSRSDERPLPRSGELQVF